MFRESNYSKFFRFTWMINMNILNFSTSFRNILGTKTLSELLADRENIAKGLKSMIDTATDPWGIDVSLARSFFFLVPIFRLRGWR